MTFNYKWKLSDGYPAKGVVAHRKKVFGTFICGGGSSMGYKLSGYDHLGGVEIDPKIAEIYKLNHHPRYLYVESIRDFNERENLPDQLYDLDLLDGSPPCSSFSMAGKRDAHWGKSKVFAEGQTHQRLDDLVFVYAETILKLKPKAFVLENVKGLIQGNAKAYTRTICQKLIKGGYAIQVFLLNSKTMGVPQSRPRVFIIGHQQKLNFKKLKLHFNQKVIPFKKVSDAPGVNAELVKSLTPMYVRYWNEAKQNQPVGKYASRKKIGWDKVCNTINASVGHFHPFEVRELSNSEVIRISSFPSDYNFNGKDVKFICGMSVPPLMTAKIAHEIYKQWLSKL